MATTFPSPTNSWHNISYPDISPTNPTIASSIKGKNVVISGGGHGIGSATAEAFAAAGAAHIHLLGRQEAKLMSTQASIVHNHPSCTVYTHVCDITSYEATFLVAAAAGPWDIIVLNAGYLETPASLLDSSPDEWWRTFTVNVQGLYNLTRAFLGHRYGNGGEGGYGSLGKASLPAHFAVWLASPEARFLRGRFVWCNWDVKELVAMKEEIKGGLLFTTNLEGFPFKPKH